MKEVKNIELVKVLRYEDKYLVYAFKKDDYYELYLENKNYGIMSFIMGAPKTQQTLEQLLNLIDFEKEIEIYKNWED